MKIRTDFVTNSSSSSFVCVALYDKELYTFLQRLIADKKYIEQPSWALENTWIKPEAELYHDFVFEEMKFDKRYFKVQTTQQLSWTNEKTAYEYIGSFFQGLDPSEEETLRELVVKAYDDSSCRKHIYVDLTDNYAGFDFEESLPVPGTQKEIKSEEVKRLVDIIDQWAVDPETADLLMKLVSIDLSRIDYCGLYDPKCDRYSHIDKRFIETVKNPMIKRRKWRDYLRELYSDSIFEVGAIAVNGYAQNVDFAVVHDLPEGVVDRRSINSYMKRQYEVEWYEDYERIERGNWDSIKEGCYQEYLEKTVAQIEKVNKAREGKALPVAVLWESQFTDFLLQHSSLGGKAPEDYFGPKGTKRRKVPKKYKEVLHKSLKRMAQTWPDRMIDTNTKKYVCFAEEIGDLYKSIRYRSIEEFFDAYGFTLNDRSE